MENREFDVVVIGGGPGGTPAAIELATRGKQVLLVEKSGKLGGACLFVGCIPSKIIKHSSDEYFHAKRTVPGAPSLGRSRDDYWRQIQSNMKRILPSRSAAAIESIRRLGNLSFVSGCARFLSNRQVEVVEGDDRRYTIDFRHAIVATGSSSVIPPFDGNAVDSLQTSETIFSRNSLPGSLVIIGGGPIGIELAQMFARLDVKCTVIEVMGTILDGVVEPEFARGISGTLTRSGVEVHVSSKVQRIDRRDGELATTFVGPDGGVRTITSEEVLVAAGKAPNLDDLNLEATEIRHTRQGITVDEYLETTVKGVYATGDVTPAPKFAHTATYEAHLAAANILTNNSAKTNFAKNSWVLFSDPEIASAGYTEAEAVKRGIDVVTGVYDYRIDAVAQINGEPFGFLKFVVDRRTSVVVGIHIFVKDAASIAGEAALIVSRRLTLLDVAQAIYPHPTLSEAYGFLALKMLADGARN